MMLPMVVEMEVVEAKRLRGWRLCEVDVWGENDVNDSNTKKKRGQLSENFSKIEGGKSQVFVLTPRMPRGPGYHLPLCQSEFSPSFIPADSPDILGP